MSLHDLLVRPATAADAQELARLNIAFNGGDQTAEQLARRLADPQRVETPLVAFVDERAVGFAALRLVPCVFYPEPHAELTELYVEAAYRRRGVARALVALAERLAIAGGARELLVLTDFDNHAAQALYRSLGFAEDDLALRKGLARVALATDGNVRGVE
jgi:ribosomal protein S18 acetylase RimI-like enzyme